jgi:elongation factor Ts
MPAAHAERRNGQEGTMTTSTIKPEDVKRLREKTGAGIMDCKRALEESAGDFERATLWLREKGLSTAAAKAGRAAREGIISSYIHHGERLGVLLELNCETDFVARTDDFQQLARELAMQVAGLAPTWVSRDDVPAEVLEEQRKQFAGEAERDGRPADRVPEIVEGKLNKWLESVCLLEMAFRDTEKRVSDLISEKIALLGENIRVARFARMAVGETAEREGQEAA